MKKELARKALHCLSLAYLLAYQHLGKDGAMRLLEAILLDRKRILPCSAWLDGEYGMKGLFLGVPCKLGRKGLEKIIEVELTPDEKAALKKSGDAVLDPMKVVKI